VVAKEVLRTFSAKPYAKREAFLYVNSDKIIQEDNHKRVATATRIEQEQYGYEYEARATRTTKKEGCIGGRRKASSILVGRRSKKKEVTHHQYENATRPRIELPQVSSEEASIDEAVKPIASMRRRKEITP